MEIAGFGVEDWLNVYEKEAKFDIAQSSIAAFTLEEIIEIDGTDVDTFFEKLAKMEVNDGWIEGSPEFKTEVSQLYQSVKPENILQTNGATGANLLAMYALVEPHDHVISMYPSYQQLYDIPRSFGAKVEFWHLKEENDWKPDMDELKKIVREDTKIICLNNANNPTGTLLDEKLLKEVVAIAKSVAAYVLVDEVYAPLTEEDRIISIADLYDKGIATNSLSKTYSVPGIRIGWTASSHEIADCLRKYRDYTMICSGIIEDGLAVQILKNKEEIWTRNKKIVANNLKIVADWVVQEPRVSLVLPNYVSTSFIHLDIDESDEAFCKDLLKNQ